MTIWRNTQMTKLELELELERFIFHRKWVKFTLLKNYCHISQNLYYCIVVLSSLVM